MKNESIHEIEELGKSDNPELLDLFNEAFEDYPLIPLLSAKPKATRAVMKAFLGFFGSTKSSFLYGIRQGDKLVCGSVSIDSTTEPSRFALIRFIFSLIRALGWRTAKMFEEIHKEETKYKFEERHFELVILGMLPTHQRMGCGRKMLHFLIEKARNEEYKGVILVANKDSPAFHFYLKEGFIVEKEFDVGEVTLCWMRLVF